MKNAITIPESVYIGNVDLNDKEREVFAFIFFTNLEHALADAQDQYMRNFSPVEILKAKKMCRVIENGDSRHPGYWPIDDEDLYRSNRQPVETFHYAKPMAESPITVNGVTLPPFYAQWVFGIFYKQHMWQQRGKVIAGTSITEEELMAMCDKIQAAEY